MRIRDPRRLPVAQVSAQLAGRAGQTDISAQQSDGGALNEGGRDVGASDDSASDDGKPDDGAPDDSASVDSASDDGKPDELVLDIGPVAHGGHCVARISSGPDAGRVVFVRHALPGERVRALITSRGKVWRADAVAVLANPSEYRVPSPWPAAGPGGVGGGELAHVSIAGQRRWKAAVIAEQLQRLAGIATKEISPELDVNPRTLQPTSGQLASGDIVETLGHENGYRTRVELVTDANGNVGMSKPRSNDIMPIKEMPLATPALQEFLTKQNVWQTTWPANARITAIVPANATADDGILLVNQEPWLNGAKLAATAKTEVIEQLNYGTKNYQYQVNANGFWQVHEKAPQWLVETVLAAANLQQGQRVFDLYSGAGLFTLPIADAVGSEGKVIAIEGDKTAAHYAKLNAKKYPQITVKPGDVLKTLCQIQSGASGNAITNADVVVLDPPRVGAGKQIVTQIAALAPNRVVYVACDPAALARDIGYFQDLGYKLTALKAADLFPMTHHVECVATLER